MIFVSRVSAPIKSCQNHFHASCHTVISLQHQPKKNTIAVMKLQIRNNILVVDCKLIGAEMNLEKLTSFENWTLHWMKEVCFDMYLHSYRSGYLRYDSEVTEKSIKLYRFKVPEDMYRSGDDYPPNKGFCVPPGCLPSGLLNISLCQPMSK